MSANKISDNLQDENNLVEKYPYMKLSGKQLHEKTSTDNSNLIYGLFVRMSHERSVKSGSGDRHVQKIKNEALKNKYVLNLIL